MQSDWGGEFRSLHKYLHSQGINHRITCPYTYQQAGAMERCRRQIVEVGLSLLDHSKLPQIFWEDAFVTAVYIINRLPTPVLNNISPYKMVHKHKPNYNFLCAFGCACWPYLRLTLDIKWIFDKKNCIFIGYSTGHQDYKCLDVSTGKNFISRHVVFDESIYPYTVPTSASLTTKSDLVVLPLNLQLSSSSSLISVGTVNQTPAPSQLYMISPSSPSNYLYDNSTSPASNTTPSHL
jgi:histone deacetylase 1/2